MTNQIKITLPTDPAELERFTEQLAQTVNARLKENTAKAEHVLVVVQVWKLTGAELAKEFGAELINSDVADAIIDEIGPDATARAVSVYAPGIVKVVALARGLALNQNQK